MSDYQIPIYDSDGKPWTIDPKYLDVAISQGARIASPDEILFEKQKAGADGPLGEFVAAGSNVANQLSFGAFDPLARHFTPETFQKIQAARAANPKSASAGNILGFGSSVVAAPLGGIAKAGEAAGSIAGKIGGELAAKAVQYGTEGALVSAPLAAAQAISHPDDIGEALATIGTGALIGGGIGAGVVGGKYIINKAAPASRNLMMNLLSRAFPEIETVERPVPTAAQAFGVKPSTIQGLQDDIQKVSQGIATNQAKKVLGFNKSQFTKAGKRFQGINAEEATDDIARYFLDNNLFEHLDTPGTLSEKVKNLLNNKVGPALNTIRKDLDKAEIGYFDPYEVLGSLEANVGLALEDPLYSNVKSQYSNIVDSLIHRAEKAEAAGKPGLTFKDMGEFTGDLFKLSRNLTGELRAGKFIVDDARLAFNDLVDYQADQVAQTMLEHGNLSLDKQSEWLGLAERFRGKRKEYAMLKSAASSLEDRLSRVQGNQFFTPSSGATGIIGSVIGGVPGAVAGITLNQIRQAYGANAAAIWANSVDQAIRTQQFTIDKAVAGFFTASRNLDPRPKAGKMLRSLFLPENRLTDGQALKRLSDNINQLTTNTNGTIQLLGEIAGNVVSNVPEYAAQMNMKAIQVATYLQREIPKQGTPDPYSDFQYEPSAYDVSVFERKLRAAVAPMSILDDLKSASLTQDQVDAVKELYPRIYQRIVESLISQLGNRNRNLSNTERYQLSLFLGNQTSNLFKPDAMKIFQGNFAAEAAAQQAQRALQTKTPKSLGAEQMKTPTQKIQEKKLK